MPEFISGLKLSQAFFENTVRPILERTVPGLKYSAALIGSGSEVLGFDDAMSADHHWGPRVMLFLGENDHESFRETISKTMRAELPTKFLGYPTNFSEPDPNDNNVQQLVAVETGPVNHRVESYTIRGYLRAYLNFDMGDVIEPADWLTFPEQKLRTIACGAIFEDRVGLEEICRVFAWYPDDVWLYLLASGWNRIGQEEHLMGRAGLAGDEIGSALIASRLVRDIMRLCFLMDRSYAPYPKWFGTAFRRLACADSMLPHLEAVLRSSSWQEREKHLVPTYERLAEMHNGLGITEPLTARSANFFGRPFRVIEQTGGFAAAIDARITENVVRRIADKGLIGSIDQISDNTDIVSDPQWRTDLRKLYE